MAKNNTLRMLTSLLTETLPIPVLDEWRETQWEAGQRESLIVGLEIEGDCQEGYLMQLMDKDWIELGTR
jgi:hypothetical protein